MSDIYAQHRAAFRDVSAYIVMRNGERVATIAFKYPRDGAGRLYAYVHIIGIPMVRGHASGGGYDKHSAACAAAAERMVVFRPSDPQPPYASAIAAALSRDDGYEWAHHLRNAGFDVFEAV